MLEILPRPADIPPAEFDLRPGKRPVIEDPGERLYLRRPLCLLEAVVAEVEPPPRFTDDVGWRPQTWQGSFFAAGRGM